MQSRILKESKYNHETESHQGVIHETFQPKPAQFFSSSAAWTRPRKMEMASGTFGLGNAMKMHGTS